MTRMASAVVLALTMTVGAVVHGSADTGVSLTVFAPTGRPPSSIRMVVRLQPNEMNREIVVEVESQDMFTSSVVPLEGDSAPAAHWMDFKSLPAGSYTVTVSLLRSDASVTTVTDTFRVMGSQPN